jgi:protein involved in polysaccharide export with SLBB domain
MLRSFMPPSRTARNFSPVKASLLAGLFLGCLLLAGCGGSNSAPAPNAGANIPSDAMRVGDKITVRLTGVPTDESYINEIQIPESGDITVPDLTTSFHASGIRPGELAGEITAAYKRSQIYTNPNVTVIPEDRFVNVGGDVRSPARVLYTPDLTLLGAINSCGGFDEYADKHHVRILRGTQIITTDAALATHTAGLDPQVYPGDQITVPRTIF